MNQEIEMVTPQKDSVQLLNQQQSANSSMNRRSKMSRKEDTAKKPTLPPKNLPKISVEAHTVAIQNYN
jgi:hypothetical protein